MAEPVHKVVRFLEELHDATRVNTPLRMLQIARECERLMRTERDFGLVADLHTAAGVAYGNLGRNEEAAEHFRVASALDRGRLEAANNWSLALVLVGRPVEAEAEARRALDLPGGSMSMHTLANLALALFAQRRGRESWRMFHQVIGLADLGNPLHLHLIATRAAQINDDLRASDYFARFLSTAFGDGAVPKDPVGYIDQAPSEWFERVSTSPSLVAAIERCSLDPVARSLLSAPEDDEPVTAEDLAAIEDAHNSTEPPLTSAEVRARIAGRE